MFLCPISCRGQNGLKANCNPQNGSAFFTFPDPLIYFKYILFKEKVYIYFFSYSIAKSSEMNLRNSSKVLMPVYIFFYI
jgi:hypothetical protein